MEISKIYRSHNVFYSSLSHSVHDDELGQSRQLIMMIEIVVINSTSKMKMGTMIKKKVMLMETKAIHFIKWWNLHLLIFL